MLDKIIIDGLSFALPLFVMAIGGIYSERSGITNLALEGLQGAGAFVGALVATFLMLALPSGSQIPYYAAMFTAMIGGMLYAMLHAVLCVNFKANQVISGIVINILAMALTVFLTKVVNRVAFGAASDKFLLNVSSRWTIPGLSAIPVVGAVFKDMYPFEVIIVVVAVIAWYVLYRTRYGMYLRACGDNPQAVDAAGIDVAKIRFTAVMISGALSGLAGMCFAYSISAKYASTIYVGYGYLSIAALIFGSWKILPTLGACLLFGFAKSAGHQIVQLAEMPSSYSDLVMVFPYVLTLLLLIFFSKHNAAPRALGEIYDKGKR